jgi:four helix bundle protein
MAGTKGFEDLIAWKLAQDLKTLARGLCQRPVVKSDWDFTRQLTDAARSAPRNIAEGFGRFKHADFARFVRIARASAPRYTNVVSTR